MRALKSVFGLALALLPILYFGYLFYYFFDVSGSIEEAQTNGLGPTLLGLGIVVLLFCIPFGFKLFKFLGGPRSGGSGRRGGEDESEDAFDADAVVARYLARQAKEPTREPPQSAPATRIKKPAAGGPASFGRRSR